MTKKEEEMMDLRSRCSKCYDSDTKQECHSLVIKQEQDYYASVKSAYCNLYNLEIEDYRDDYQGWFIEKLTECSKDLIPDKGNARVLKELQEIKKEISAIQRLLKFL